jgi:L-ascorbate metabolism protein UlaG (beta-lactamase superfamily)
VTITLEWLGCATFRLTIGELVLFLDAYVDRVPTAPRVGITTVDIDRADYVLVGHSHFDHLSGAEIIAQRTGAKIIGSNESCHVMGRCGVPREQLLPSQGGEHHRLSSDVTVRVYPSLHACLWATSGEGDLGTPRTGDLGLCEDERRALFVERSALGTSLRADTEWARMAQEHLRSTQGSNRDGGALAYVIETPAGSIFYQDTSGCWSGVLHELRADAAILALSGRANVDGEPFQGSLAQFAAQEASWLRPRQVVFGHHDNWFGMPDQADVADVSPAREAVSRAVPGVAVLEPGFLGPVRLLG